MTYRGYEISTAFDKVFVTIKDEQLAFASLDEAMRAIDATEENRKELAECLGIGLKRSIMQ